MTLKQCANKVRENLADYGITFYSQSDIYDSIQDAYDEVVVYSECYERIIDIPLDHLIQSPGNAHPWINVKFLIQDYYRIIAVLNRTTREFIHPTLDRDEDDLRLDWQLRDTGNVFNFVINGCEWIALPNAYITSSHKPIRFFYKATPPKVVSTEFAVYPIPESEVFPFADENHVFKILTEYQKLIELYVTADLLEQNQEFQKSTVYWGQYEPMLEEYRKKVLALAKSDRIYARMLENC